MPTLTVHGVEHYYEIHGNGPPLVLLNGILMNAAGWAYQLKGLTPYYRVLVYDMRGQGASGKPEQAYYDLQQQADDLAELLTQLGIQRTHVVGLSYGGAVAQYFAARFSDRVDRLVLADTMAWSDGVNEAIADGWAAAGAVSADLRFQFMLPLTFGRRFLEVHRERLPLFSQQSAMLDWAVVMRLVDGMRRHDARAILRQIAVPTLVLVGEEDRFCPLHHAQYLAQHIPGATLEILPECGHATAIEAPEAFNASVRAFLG